MKYEAFKKSNFIKIKNTNLSNFIDFKYGIDKSCHGKNLQAAFIRKFIKLIFSKIFSFKVENVYYKNSNNSSFVYSKDWWKI
jgi:hypothetical protein